MDLVQEQAGKINTLEEQQIRYANIVQALLDRVRKLETTR